MAQHLGLPNLLELLNDPKMKIETGGLWRPNSITSPIINRSVGDYLYVTLDMDGQPRFGTKDVALMKFLPIR